MDSFITHAISGQLLVAEAWVRSQGSSCGLFFVERVALGQVCLRVIGVFLDSRHSVICHLWVGQLTRYRLEFHDTVRPRTRGSIDTEFHAHTEW
jgi:hypothetical protein